MFMDGNILYQQTKRTEFKVILNNGTIYFQHKYTHNWITFKHDVSIKFPNNLHCKVIKLISIYLRSHINLIFKPKKCLPARPHNSIFRVKLLQN